MSHTNVLRAILLVAPLSLASCGSTMDLTAYAPRTCEVHHAELKRDTVPIHYGLMVPDARSREARKAFPRANREVWSGCAHGFDSPRRARVLYCPDCRKVESAFAARDRV
jgi:hypothetical protein